MGSESLVTCDTGSMVDTVSKGMQVAQGVAQIISGRAGGARLEHAQIRAGAQREPSRPIAELLMWKRDWLRVNGLAHWTLLSADARAWQHPLHRIGRTMAFASTSCSQKVCCNIVYYQED